MLDEGTTYRQVYDAAKDYLAMYELRESAESDLQRSWLTETLDISLSCLRRVMDPDGVQRTIADERSTDVPQV